MILQCRLSLEGHHRQPQHIGLMLPDQPLDCLPHAVLHQNQVRSHDSMVSVDIAGQ